MKHFKHIALIFVIVTLCMSVGVSIGPQSTSSKRTYLAVGLFTGASSSLPTYAFITFSNGYIVGAQVVREQRFMYTALGHWPSPANPKRENLLEINNIDSCFLLSNEFDKVNGYYCKPFSYLWKIRFYESPYAFDSRGWSQGRIKPSLYQAEFIQKHYGVKNVLTEYFYGDALFKLLRDIQDDTWINTYSSITKTDSIIQKP